MKYLLCSGGVLIVYLLIVFYQKKTDENTLSLGTADKTSSKLDEISAASPPTQFKPIRKGKRQVSVTKPDSSAQGTNKFLFDQSQAKLRNNPNDPKQVHADANELNTQKLSGKEELEKVYSILSSFRVSANKGFFPTGFNYEITNALLGDNSAKVAFISSDNRRINSQGELVDQWNTPYFFHAESSQKMTLRSAGPDQKMFTEDDLLSYEVRN